MAMADNVGGFWRGLDRTARIGLTLGVLLVVAAIAVLGWWLLKRDYQVLFSGLEQRDAAAIVEELKRQKVPYRIERDGSTIAVPAEKVHETRLALMGRGVPLSGGVGFEIFDKQDMGVTDYTQRVNYQRALQGELARTILSIQQVVQARVHLVLPENSLFRRERNRPKASVSLVLKPGSRLDAEQVVGIQRLVAASAPGLEPDMVTIIDQKGVPLTAMAVEGNAALASGQLRIKREVEDYLARKVADVLDRAFGPGQAIVSVDATLDFDEVRRTVQDVVPNRPGSAEGGILVRKREVVQKQEEPGYSRRTAEGSGEYSPAQSYTSTTEADYEVGRRVEQLVKSPGSVRRLSVGVLVPKALDSGQLFGLRSLVIMAAGVDEGRGDALAIQSVDQLALTDPRLAAAPVASEHGGTPASVPAVHADRGGMDTLNLTLLAGVAASAVVLVLLVAARVRSARRPVIAAPGAEADEARRAALLREIRDWLEEERGRPAGGTQP